jgi:hypothetical protein
MNFQEVLKSPNKTFLKNIEEYYSKHKEKENKTETEEKISLDQKTAKKFFSVLQQEIKKKDPNNKKEKIHNINILLTTITNVNEIDDSAHENFLKENIPKVLKEIFNSVEVFFQNFFKGKLLEEKDALLEKKVWEDLFINFLVTINSFINNNEQLKINFGKDYLLQLFNYLLEDRFEVFLKRKIGDTINSLIQHCNENKILFFAQNKNDKDDFSIVLLSKLSKIIQNCGGK